MDNISKKHLEALKELGVEHPEERLVHFRALVKRLSRDMIHEIDHSSRLGHETGLLHQVIPIQATYIPDETW